MPKEIPCLLSQRISELEYENERLRATIREIVGDCVVALDVQALPTAKRLVPPLARLVVRTNG